MNEGLRRETGGPVSAAAARVQAALAAAGLSSQVVELPASTRTAKEAAAAIGCRVAEIAKTLVFRCADGQPVLVIASGSNRVDEERLGELLGQPVAKADAEFVRRHTGFAIGGVPPLGLASPIESLLDADLFSLGTLWAAAGTPHAVFPVTADQLLQATGGRMASLAASPRHRAD